MRPPEIARGPAEIAGATGTAKRARRVKTAFRISRNSIETSSHAQWYTLGFMRIALFFLLSLAGLAKDVDFNGRWNITVPNETRRRAWWLEVDGAGTQAIKGRFVGAPGGDMNAIPEIAVKGGVLRFVFERNYLRKPTGTDKGVYTARIVNGDLVGEFQVEGNPASKLAFVGKRAPVIKDTEDGKWKPGKPVELFNGKDLNNWSALVPGKPLGWRVDKGIMNNIAGANNLVSSQKFWNFELHGEFRLGVGSNAGLGLRGRNQVQIIDDYGKAPDTHGTGALYSRIKPRENAAKKPGEWNTYDIRLVGRTVTIIVNGVTVIDRAEVEGLTAMAHDPNEATPGPISVQGDHGAVEIRKLTVTPLVR